MAKPVLQAMVLADNVYQDRPTGKYIIAGTFSEVFLIPPTVNPQHEAGLSAGQRQMIAGPIQRAGSPYLYIALVDVHGKVSINLKFVDLSDASVLFEGHLELTSSDPIVIAEYSVAMPMLPIPKAGSYSLDLLHDGEILGSWRILAKLPENPPTQLGANS